VAKSKDGRDGYYTLGIRENGGGCSWTVHARGPLFGVFFQNGAGLSCRWGNRFIRGLIHLHFGGEFGTIFSFLAQSSRHFGMGKALTGGDWDFSFQRFTYRAANGGSNLGAVWLFGGLAVCLI